MDWSRAKTILIFTFIMLNLFLGLQLNQLVEQQSDYVETEEISLMQLKQIAKKNNIRFADEPSQTPVRLSAYNATITPIKQDGWKRDERGSYSKTFASPLPFQNDRKLNELLSREVPYFANYQRTSTLKEKRTYVQTVNGRPIWDATLEVEFAGNAIKALRIVHYELTQLPTQEELLPYPSALYQVIINLNTSGPTSIDHPKLGYRAKAYSGERQILVPYWQFEVGNNLIYVNAIKRGANEKIEIVPKQQTESKGSKQL